MDSSGLGSLKKELENWYPFEKQSIEKAPRKKGIYVIRLATFKPIGRLRGESDILYIGSTTSEGGLRQRLMQYFHPGPTQWTNQRLYGFLKKYHMEITWCPCEEPTNLEHDLLRQYLSEHDELPPFNHADIRRLYESVADHIGLSDSVTVIKTKGTQADGSN